MKDKAYRAHQKTWLYRLSMFGFFIILALPLLNWPIYFSPPNWAKTFVFQIIFAIVLFIFLCQILWQRRSHIFDRVKKIDGSNSAFWLLLLLFAAYLLATIFSLDFRYSFFGSPYRAGGFINYGFYILFAAITFLVVKDRDWQKLWDFSIFIGVVVSLFALISRFGLFSSFFISRIDNLSSTIGGPNTLGLYLMLLVFPALSFGMQTIKKIKKIYYLISFFLFCFIILLTISQGAYLGLGVGMLFFIIFYPSKSKKILYSKTIFITLIVLTIATALLIKNTDSAINEHYLFGHLTTWKIDQSRLSTWKISYNAFLDRPILGYGPENFSIGFDRNYDPSLPLIEMEPGTPASWWDKAHNFAFSLLVETGALGFMAFALLFGSIFWKLHALAHPRQSDSQDAQEHATNPNLITAHGLQATLIAYFANLMFNFENFSSYILVFLIVGYSLSLTIKNPQQTTSKGQQDSKITSFFFRTRKGIAGIVFLLLICFIWVFNIKPFGANAQLNKAIYLSSQGVCSQAMHIMDEELKKHSIIDGYIRIKYIEILKRCMQLYPENDVLYAQRAIPAMQENTTIMPYYTRNWLIMVGFNNVLAVAEQDPNKKRAILDQSKGWLKKVESLSPKRHEILVETLHFEIFAGEYESARQTSENCTKEYPDFNACWWYLGLSEIYLSKDNESLQEGKKHMEKAMAMGYSQLSQYSLIQLANLYLNRNDYKGLEWTYEKLSQFYPSNLRYFAGLAIVYKKNNKLAESREALKNILKIQANTNSKENGRTESQEIVIFLIENILELKENNPDYHSTLYDLQLELGNKKEAQHEAQRYYDAYIQQSEAKNNPALLAQAKETLDAMLEKTK